MAMRHSVVLDVKRCRGCTTCIKCCPTEAIRVRGRRATILPDRCIDCGSCIRICPHKAIKSVGDSLDILNNYQYCVALPEPALYGQFHHLDSVDIVLSALLKIGFHKVYEVAKAAELISDYERQTITSGVSKATPQISSSCPTVLRLIRMRFPKLIGHVANTILPMELAAILARREAEQETGLPPEKIGVFAIVPCSSKVTAARSPEGLEHPVLDGAFAIRDIYLRLLTPMKELEEVLPLSEAGIMGIGWATCGGESAARLGERCASVDGIQNVIQMLEGIEDGRLPEADFLELSACTQGCVGGCFNVENPYAAKLRLKGLMKGLPVSRKPLPPAGGGAGRGVPGQGAAVLTRLCAGSGSGSGLQQAAPDPGAGGTPARPPLRLLRGALLPGLCRGCGAGPRLGGRLHLQGAGADALHDRQQGRGRRLPAPALPPPAGAGQVTRHANAAVMRPAPRRRFAICKEVTNMTVQELTGALSLTVYHLETPDRPVTSGYAGDLLSWVLGRAERDCAWLTIMSNQNVAAVALMAEAACVVLTEGVTPDGELLRRAAEKGVNLLGTELDTFTAAHRLAGMLSP